MLARPKVTPFRWADFGRDLRAIVLDDGSMLWLAVDICDALELDVPVESDKAWPVPNVTRLFPGHTQLVETLGGYADRDVDDVYDTAEVRRLAIDNPEWFTSQFLDFLRETQYPEGAPLRVAMFREPEPALAEITAGRTYSVARAARLLARDPAIRNIGQHSLFEAMQVHGWISRDREIWIPNEDRLRLGHLVRQKQRVQGRKELYPQIRITRDGLQTLHTILGGIATVALDDEPNLTLVELP